MTTVHFVADPLASVCSSPSPSDYLAHERRLQSCLRSLQARGWQQRLTPLAQHMAQQRLVCGRGYAAAPLRHLDTGVLREALSRMLRHEWGTGGLIYHLAVEGAQPSRLAAERGVSQAVLVDMLRNAIGKLATEYQAVAYAAIGEGEHERVRAALAHKRR